MDRPVLETKLELIARTYGLAGEQRTQLPRTFLVDAGGRCGRSTEWRGRIWRRRSRRTWSVEDTGAAGDGGEVARSGFRIRWRETAAPLFFRDYRSSMFLAELLGRIVPTL